MAKSGSYTAKIGLDISDVDKKINSLSRELKTIDSDMKTNSSSTELLQQHYTTTAEKAKALAEKLQLLQGAREDVLNAFNSGQISGEELRAYEREVESTQQALRDCMPDLLDFSGAFDVLGEALQKATQLAAAFVQESIEVGKAFEGAMSQVAATMGITRASEEFEALSEKAKDVGANTRYTATEAAEALNYLALAGYDAEEAIGAVDSVVNLAQAGGMDLARASDMLTDSITAFGLEGNNAAERLANMNSLVDKMAVTAQSTNTSVSMLGDAFLQLGATGRSIAGREGGVTELSTVLGVLANSGIKASEGGTHLRNILLKMSKPTKNLTALCEKLDMSFYDLEGNMRPLPEIFTEMNDKMTELNLTQMERDELLNKAFNPTDVAAVNTLLGTTAERYEELAQKIDDSAGAAAAMGSTMNDNLEGALRTMQSAKEAVENELYEKIAEPLKDLANIAAQALRDTATEIKEAGLGDQFTEALQKIADAAREALPKVMDLFTRFVEEVVPKLGDLALKVTDITTDEVLPKLIDMFEWLIDHGDQVEGAIKLVIAAMAFDKVQSFTTGIANLAGQFTALSSQAGAAAGAIGGATGAIGGQANALGGAAGLIGKLNLYAIAMEAAITVGLLLKDVIDQQTEAMKEQAKYLNGSTGESNAALERYTEAGEIRTTGKSDKSAEEYKKQLDEDKKRLTELQAQADKLVELQEKAFAVGASMDDQQAYEDYKTLIGMDEEQLGKAIENYENLVHQEEEAYNKLAKVGTVNDETDRRIAEERRRATEYANRSQTASMAAAIEEGGDEVVEAIESVKGKEEKVQRDAANAYKAQLEYEVADRIKSEEAANEEYINWIKNNLDEGTELYNKEMAAALKKRDKFAQERDKAEEKRRKEQEEAEKERQREQKKEREENVNRQKAEIQQALHDDDNLAKKEGFSKAEKLQKKIETLEKYKAEGKLYEENVAEVDRQLADLRADLEEQNREDREKKEQEEQKKWEEEEEKRKSELTKQWQKIEKTDLEAQEAFLKSLSLKDKELFDKFLEEYAENVNDWEKKRADALLKTEEQAKETVKKIGKIYEEQADNIAKAVSSGEVKKDAKTGQDRYIFTDYKKRLQELKEYQRNLTRLQSMDIPQEMIKDIFSMDYSTRALYIKELLNLSAGNRQKYINEFMAFRSTAKSVGVQEADYARNDEIGDLIKDDLEDVKKTAEEYGGASWAAYCKGWQEEMKKRGLTLDSEYLAMAAVNSAFTPTPQPAAAQQIEAERIAAETSAAVAQAMKDAAGMITVNIDGKSVFADAFKFFQSKAINVSSKTGGVLA